MTKAIIQHNFTSGLGDCIVAIHEYVQTARNLKSLGFNNINLYINTNNNLYYNKLNLFDLFDSSIFSIFNRVEHIHNPHVSIEGYKIGHLSYGANSPGLHWWDLFIDADYFLNNLNIATFPHSGYTFQKLPSENLCLFSTDIISKFNTLQFSQSYVCLHIRTQDLDEEKNIYENNKDKIDEIYQSYPYVFVCSNSYSIKKELINNKKTLYFTHTLESSMSNHHNYKNKISDDLAKEKTIDTIMDMMGTMQAHKIYTLTSWNRISNFLFPALIHQVPIEII